MSCFLGSKSVAYSNSAEGKVSLFVVETLSSAWLDGSPRNLPIGSSCSLSMFWCRVPVV